MGTQFLVYGHMPELTMEYAPVGVEMHACAACRQGDLTADGRCDYCGTYTL